ncbi:hypothetical protein [Rhodanobacter sp. 115]|uniref:hypothetical protein n=1 Tax=Rhodanobacter sp. FW021-MT20 TaxID=1162282 RepID=UPI000260E3CC|nr:hypothetical protein [Rhodanobacter sp. 115]EIL90934.1 hypothetical protein UU5_14728 [Rhodanobacter sp. 115]
MEKKHPILVPNGFQIYTKPTEAVANFILGHIENDHHGASFFGGGGLARRVRSSISPITPRDGSSTSTAVRSAWRHD